MILRHRWHVIPLAADPTLHRCACGAERITAREGAAQKQFYFRSEPESDWARSSPPCKPSLAQVDLYDYAPDEEDPPLYVEPKKKPAPRPHAPQTHSYHRKPSHWALASFDAYAALGIEPSPAINAPTPMPLEDLQAKGFEVFLQFDDEQCFEFGLLAQGIAMNADVMWSDVTTETMALRRAAHQMLTIAQEMVSRGLRSGARAGLRNRTTGMILQWKFENGRWTRTDGS